MTAWGKGRKIRSLEFKIAPLNSDRRIGVTPKEL